MGTWKQQKADVNEQTALEHEPGTYYPPIAMSLIMIQQGHRYEHPLMSLLVVTLTPF